MLDVPDAVVLDESVPKVTFVVASVKVKVSSTDAVTVTIPAVEVATVPVSIAVVQAASE